MRILYAEDEVKINMLVEDALKKEGYTVDAFFDGDAALRAFYQNDYDLIILDIMMPKKDGFEVMKDIRVKNKTVPILALSAKNDLNSKVTGLDNGFDDYVEKPFKMEELKARVRAIFRRVSTHETVLTVGNLELEPASKRVMLDGNEVMLTAKEYSILEYLMRNKNRFKSESEILENIWDHASETSSNVVAVHLKNLKKKIESENEIITSERGKGYIIRSN